MFSTFFGKKKTHSINQLPKKPHPLRGWTNFGLYEVRGTNLRTGRSNKKTVEALDEAGAKEAALTAGLSEPISAIEIQRRMITDAQADYLRRLQVSFSGHESIEDASAMICMITDGETPVDRITDEQWAAACAAKVCISAMSCQKLYRHCMKEAKL